jgi:hypothetical protein
MAFDKLRFTPTAVWHPTGFTLAVTAGSRGYPELDRVASFESLNPQVRFVHCMSRWDMFKLGLWLVRRSASAAPSAEKI